MAMIETAEAPPALRCPTDFRYEEMLGRAGIANLRRVLKGLLRFDPVPSPELASAFCEDMFAGDPLAEAYVAEALSGEGDERRRQRRLLETALTSPGGFASVADAAPPSMRTLFEEFET